MKSLIIIFGTLLLLIATPFIFQAITDTVTEDYSQSIAGVTTGAGVYAANVTMSRDIYNNDTSAVSLITSNISTDAPAAYSYNSVSNQLWVSGLDESQMRTLVVSTAIDSTSLPAGASLMIGLLRWFWVFIIIGMSGGAIYAFFD